MITQKTFQELSKDELYQILKLRVDVFVVEQNCAYPELDDLDHTAGHFFVDSHDQIISYLRTYFKNEEESAIGRIVTHPDHRGQGLGRLLVEAAISELKKNSTIIHLQAQEHLAKYYQSFGFVTSSDPYDWDGIPHIDMKMEC